MVKPSIFVSPGWVSMRFLRWTRRVGHVFGPRSPELVRRVGRLRGAFHWYFYRYIMLYLSSLIIDFLIYIYIYIYYIIYILCIYHIISYHIILYYIILYYLYLQAMASQKFREWSRRDYRYHEVSIWRWRHLATRVTPIVGSISCSAFFRHNQMIKILNIGCGSQEFWTSARNCEHQPSLF